MLQMNCLIELELGRFWPTEIKLGLWFNDWFIFLLSSDNSSNGFVTVKDNDTPSTDMILSVLGVTLFFFHQKNLIPMDIIVLLLIYIINRFLFYEILFAFLITPTNSLLQLSNKVSLVSCFRILMHSSAP